MVLIIISIINLQDGKDIDKYKTLLKVASALIALAWFLIAIWSLWSLSKTRVSHTRGSVPSFRGGKLVSLTPTPLMIRAILTSTSSCTQFSSLFLSFVSVSPTQSRFSNSKSQTLHPASCLQRPSRCVLV